MTIKEIIGELKDLNLTALNEKLRTIQRIIDNLSTSSDSSSSSSSTSDSEVSYSNNWTRLIPSSITLNTGTSTDDLADLQERLDGNVYHIDEVTGVPGFDLIVDFTEVENFDIIDILGYYADGGLVSHYCNINLYNFTTETWDTIDAIEGASLDNVTYQFQIFDTEPYIYAGNVRIQFYHPVSGNAAHDLYLDSVVLYVNNIV